MTLQALSTPRFVRKTRLGPNEYRKNFHQIDREVMTAISSAEADRITPLMSKIYLRMVNAPEKFWEREGVLRVEAELQEGKAVKAWALLCNLLGVASATASKALAWMHDQGIIGYFSGKNGVGMRIFLNRALSSIGKREAADGKKNLPNSFTSHNETRTSPNEPAFRDSYAVLEDLDKCLNPHAPKNGADTRPTSVTTPLSRSTETTKSALVFAAAPHPAPTASLELLVERLRRELEPSVQTAAARAATQAAVREHARTREWLDKSGIPKATRVAQKQAFDVLRNFGVLDAARDKARQGTQVGRNGEAGTDPRPAPGPLTPEQIAEAAELCVALFEAQGKSVDDTLAGMTSAAGGWVLADDAPRVRTAALSLLRAKGSGGREPVTPSPPA